jgi:hypothetical protein
MVIAEKESVMPGLPPGTRKGGTTYLHHSQANAKKIDW